MLRSVFEEALLDEGFRVVAAHVMGGVSNEADESRFREHLAAVLEDADLNVRPLRRVLVRREVHAERGHVPREQRRVPAQELVLPVGEVGAKVRRDNLANLPPQPLDLSQPLVQVGKNLQKERW